MEESMLSPDNALDIPLKTDGSTFEIDELKDSQRQIITYTFKRFMEWLERKPQEKRFAKNLSEKQIQKTEYDQYKLTRMTISGAGGTGKSVLIKTLITTARRMFKRNDVAFVGAPTGSAGHNAGGEMNHKLFGINSRSGEVSSKKKKHSSNGLQIPCSL